MYANPLLRSSLLPARVYHKGCLASDARGALHTGPDVNRYSVAFTSYLATPTTQAAENFAPLPWRVRYTPDDPTEASLGTCSMHALITISDDAVTGAGHW